MSEPYPVEAVHDEPSDALAATRLLVREVIFPKLAVTYGQGMGVKFEGLNPEAVENDWAIELDGVRVEAVRYALRNLPAGDFPPNVRQFRALCNQCPVEGPKPEPRQKRIEADGSILPEGVTKFAQQLHGRIDEGEEPVQVRTARTYIARVTAPGHRISHNEKQWKVHYERVIARHDANEEARQRTAQGKADAQAKVDAHATREVGDAAHG